MGERMRELEGDGVPLYSGHPGRRRQSPSTLGGAWSGSSSLWLLEGLQWLSKVRRRVKEEVVRE